MRLYINVDHVATVRQARRTDEPDPLEAARLCEAAGADGITAHLREDRRHIQDHDLERMRPAVRVLNVELATSSEILELTCRLRPYQATLVPERREEITTEGGLDLRPGGPRLREAIRRLDEAGIRVSLFVDPDVATLDARKDLGVPAVELHTGRYANSWRQGGDALDELRRAARARRGHGSLRPRRPWAHLSERDAGGRHSGDRGAQHRAQHREPCGHGGDAQRRGGDVALGEGRPALIALGR